MFKKFTSALLSLTISAGTALSCTGLNVYAKSAEDLEQTKALSLRPVEEGENYIKSLGNTCNVSSADLKKGDVVITCGLYLESGVQQEINAAASVFGISPESVNTTDISISPMKSANGTSVMNEYYTGNHTFTTSSGINFETKCRPFFSAEVLGGLYLPHGDFMASYSDSLPDYNIDNPAISLTWVYAYGDTWLGSTSDEYPMYYFDVTLKKGAQNGKYVIDFFDFYRDAAQFQPSNLLGSVVTNFEYSNIMHDKTGEGLLELEPLTITVGEGETTSAGKIKYEDEVKLTMEIGQELELDSIIEANGNKGDGYTVVEIKNGKVTARNAGTVSVKGENSTYIITVKEPSLTFSGVKTMDEIGDSVTFKTNIASAIFADWGVQVCSDVNKINEKSQNNEYFDIKVNGSKITVTLLKFPEKSDDNCYITLVSPVSSGSRKYKLTDDTFKLKAPDCLLGDVDNDGAVNSSDASLVLAEYARLATGADSTFTSIQEYAADVNTDNAIDSSDASAILGYYAYIATGGSGKMEEYMNK
ncbi:MAG: hypothetical protein E7497_02385 [Ruminococcus sp.]|nr:hypothetical protein [Ruminococcus sp.]